MNTRTLIDSTLALANIIDKTVEYGDCLLWQGAVNADGYPQHKRQFVHGLKRREIRCCLVRRDVFELCGGVLAFRQPLGNTCGERLCVNPAHMFASTTSDIGKKAAERGAFSGITRCAKIAAAMRKDAKLTMDIARAILSSDESGPVLALRHGINRSLVTRIRAGKAWRDYSNPYLALLAA